MSEQKQRKLFLRLLCFPITFVYRVAVGVRNTLFDWKVLSQKEFDFPVISVGNITVGGTGKTPMVEYLIKMLNPQYKLGVLSRGYGRETYGYVSAKLSSKPKDIGDEMCQLFSKFPEVKMAVCANRVNGMRSLDKDSGGLDVALLDDAYQHRYIVRDVNILLIDYNRPIWDDFLLPIGRLREPAKEKLRAGIIIITKCPPDLSPMSQRIFSSDVAIRQYQTLYYTYQSYSDIMPLFPDSPNQIDFSLINKVVMVSGISSPDSFEKHIKTKYPNAVSLRYSDHYQYRSKDIREIEKKCAQGSDAEKCIIITTEKDAVKIRNLQNSITCPQCWYVLPVEVKFLNEGDEESFTKKIMGYTQKNQRNNLLHRGSI